MKYFVILSAMFAVLLGGCSQEKGDNPTPVSKTKIPLRVTTEDMTDMSDLMGMPGASGSSGGYKTITFTFETGYSVKFTLIGDPNFDGYTGLNVVVPGGTYAPSAAGNNNGGGNNGGGDAACALAALSLSADYIALSMSLATSSDPCLDINNFLTELEDLASCTGVSDFISQVDGLKSSFSCN